MLGAKIVVKHVCQYGSSLVVVAAVLLVANGCWCLGCVFAGGVGVLVLRWPWLVAVEMLGGGWVVGWCGPQNHQTTFIKVVL